jgi:hypothetical protein
MNYCSIEDAWGNPNCVGKQYDEYMENNNYIAKPEPSPVQHNTVRAVDVSNRTEHFKQQNNTRKVTPINYDITNPHDDLYDCDRFIVHIKKCRRCSNRLKYLSRPNILENVNNIIDDNRDIILLILIGISILLFFNLINSFTK